VIRFLAALVIGNSMQNITSRNLAIFYLKIDLKSSGCASGQSSAQLVTVMLNSKRLMRFTNRNSLIKKWKGQLKKAEGKGAPNGKGLTPEKAVV
jgi:hypothetical protein